MATKTRSRKAKKVTQAEPRDEVRLLILKLMKEKKVSPRDIITATGMSKNTVYEHLSGKRGMRSGNSSRILQYLRTRRTK